MRLPGFVQVGPLQFYFQAAQSPKLYLQPHYNIAYLSLYVNCTKTINNYITV